MKKILIFLALLALSGLIVSTNAEESTDTVAISEVAQYSPVDVACATNVAKDASLALDDYIDFLDQYFKIETPSSGQIETAMQRYRFFVSAIKDSFEKASVPITGSTFETNSASFAYCANVEEQYLNFGRKLLTVFSLQSGNSKRTYMMVDALKAMNAKMADFSQNFALVFPAMFKKMDDALPCYAKTCTTE